MNIFIVRMEHPDGELWNRFALEHGIYLKQLLADGRLIASGPLKGTPLRAGFLIMRAGDRAEVEAIVAGDPFSRENLICGLTIETWDPIFGLLADEASGQPPPELASLF